VKIVELLQRMEAEEASDLFLTEGKVPSLRRYGTVTEMTGQDEVNEGDMIAFFHDHLPPGIVDRVEEERDLDIGISLSDSERYRLNIFYQKGLLSLVVRRVPSGELEFADLDLPAATRDLAESPRGLVLITGATGSGKSSTMSAMLHYINCHYSKHIVTIEDPIEFVHNDHLSVVSQREVGNDTLSFARSLRHVVRQSPDVIFIGEMRDLDTIETAVSAAMTGHLVITTMHTVDASQAIDRIINYFPDHHRDQVAMDLSLALAGIISQRLLPRADGNGVIPVFEVLLNTPLIRRLIANRSLDEIPEAIKSGSGEGMQTFTRSLVERYESGAITLEMGQAAANNKGEFLLAVQGMETGIESLRREDEDGEGTRVTMKGLLKTAVKHQASDLLITAGCPPVLRITGRLRQLNMSKLSGQESQRLVFSILSPAQQAHLESERELDFALSVAGVANNDERGSLRFRVNAFYQKGFIAGAIRIIPSAIPSAAELGLPPVLLDLANREHGLVLVTGPTGAGKSTTLACMIDQINNSRSCHIITVEDPIEYVHTNKKAIIEQREVFADTKNFQTALKYVLRQDPDVILIGEMRDRETIAAALTAAETGHLVLATLHTNDATQTIDRIIDTFPADQQSQVRAQLATALLGVISQRLLPTRDSNGRVPCFEILMGTTAVQSLIRDSRTHQMHSAMETAAKDGMITMDKALMNLYNSNIIGRDIVLSLARDRNILSGV
jgi:twitching motility protein PilT